MLCLLGLGLSTWLMCADLEVGQKLVVLTPALSVRLWRLLRLFGPKTQTSHFLSLQLPVLVCTPRHLSPKGYLWKCSSFSLGTAEVTLYGFFPSFGPALPLCVTHISCSEILGRPTCLSRVVFAADWLVQCQLFWHTWKTTAHDFVVEGVCSWDPWYYHFFPESSASLDAVGTCSGLISASSWILLSVWHNRKQEFT